MAKIKKGKAKGAEQTRAQPAETRVEYAAVPQVVALHPSAAAHGAHAQLSSTAHEVHGGLWPAPAHDEDEENEEDDGWGEGAEDSGEVWDQPSPAAHEPAHEQGYGAPSGGGWGDPVPPTGGGWGAPPASSEWGQPPTPAGNGAYGMGRGNSRRGGAPTNAHAPTRAQAPAPTSLHPSAHQAAAHTMSPAQGWGAPAPAAPGWGQPTQNWGQPTQNWGQPAPPKPPAQKPAWANWANEAKMVNPQPSAATSHPYATQGAAVSGGTRQALSDQQRSQILSSLLQDPNQQTKGYFPQSQPQRHRQQQAAPPSRSQQTLHPSQQGHVDPHFLAEQQSIMRSIKETSGRGGGRHQQSRPQPVQYADSWNNWGRDTWGGDRASTIPEEDEEYEDDEWEDEGDDGWGGHGGHGGHGGGYGDGAQRVRFSPNVDYARSTSTASRTHPHAPAPAPGTSPPRQAHPQVWTPSPVSRTMKMATGTIPSMTGTVKTTVFELAPPRNGFGESAFVDSHGEALRPAERALYSRDRPARERFRWGFNPEKDPRVGSLLRWVAAMSGGLATMGLERFLETRQRGALIANADFRVPSVAGTTLQPAFDWITLPELQSTLDSTLQSSVTLYDPAFQVIIFVFLLSPSGNSMAVWRRKLNVPDAVRDANLHEILAVKAELKRSYPVYVDELPVNSEEGSPTVPKKKVRFAFIRRMFGGGKKKAS